MRLLKRVERRQEQLRIKAVPHGLLADKKGIKFPRRLGLHRGNERQSREKASSLHPRSSRKIRHSPVIIPRIYLQKDQGSNHRKLPRLTTKRRKMEDQTLGGCRGPHRVSEVDLWRNSLQRMVREWERNKVHSSPRNLIKTYDWQGVPQHAYFGDIEPPLDVKLQASPGSGTIQHKKRRGIGGQPVHDGQCLERWSM